MSDETQHRVLMLSGDLVFGSRVKSAAERAGWKFSLGGRLPDGELDDVKYVIVDLSTRSGVVTTIVGECDERCPSAKLIAYGPHVHVPKLKAARDAGIQQVITNGQFDGMLATLFD